MHILNTLIILMWEMETETVPVVIGLIKKGLEKAMEKFPGTININELQKISDILRKVLP